jgi:hypothetical protein
MSWRNRVKAGVVAALALGSGVAVGPPATAHGLGVILVPHQISGRPAPHLDGNCDIDYRRSGNARTLLYQPRVNANPAVVYLLTTDDYLFVCVRGMSRRLPGSTLNPYVSLVFDVDHDAGTAPGTDDLNLSVDEAGVTTEYHGNGVGFVPQSGGSGWRVAVDPITEVTWNAEYRIQRWKLGDPAANSVIGFQARHNSLAVHNDAFPWPADSVNNDPRTWGDLFFLGRTRSAPGPVYLDDGRVTQGLEWDVAQNANTPYDFIAGKDAMMEGRLYTLGGVSDVVYQGCRVQRIAPVVGTAQTIPVDGSLQPRIYTVPTGGYGSMGDFRCWIPASAIAATGTYRFSLVVQMDGGSMQTIDVATRTARPARAVRLMIYRWKFPAGHDEFRQWDAALNASAMDAMRDLQRVLPVPAGVGSFSFNDTPPPGAPGLRYFFAPSVYQCRVQTDETEARAVARCDATTRNQGDLMRREYDRQAAEADAGGLRHRDRIDLQEVFVSSPRSGGGQSCWSNSASAGSALDTLPTGQSHFVPIQESQHCWGQLRDESPHGMLDDHSHSQTYNFFPSTGHPMINMQTREEIPLPRGLMSQFFDAQSSTNYINEGWEFNNLRETLLGLAPPSGNAVAARTSLAALAGKPQFEIAYLLDNATESLTVQEARRIDDSILDPTPDNPDGDFRLIFKDANGDELTSLQFASTGTGHHHDGPIPVEGTVLVANLPAGAAAVEIVHVADGHSLFAQEFSASAPVVTNVSATPNGTHTLNVGWSASDVDDEKLRVNVYFQRHPDGLRSLVGSGLTGKSFSFDTSFAPGTSDGVVTVEATDGFNTDSALVKNVDVAYKAPDVSISSPQRDATLVAGRPVRLVGSGYDRNTMREVAGANLSWRVDGDAVGTGQARTINGLTAGTHRITLIATAGALKSTRTVTVTVLPDSDKDAVPNGFENKYACIDSKHADSIGDPDVDQVSTFAEWQYGTNPCRADSDKDGWSDGDELARGVNPKAPKQTPDAARLYLDTKDRDLGSCPTPKTIDVAVGAVNDDVLWTARSDAAFVSVTDGSPGTGSLVITPVCTGLPSGRTYWATVGVQENSGQFYSLRVHFET